jgi:hypothetical protein
VQKTSKGWFELRVRDSHTIMFSVTGLLQTSRCPDAQCTRPHCIFSHSNGVPDEIAIPVHVAQSVKRPSEVISDQRPTKVQKVGPSHRPRAVPTASTSSVCLSLHFSIYLSRLFLVRHARSQDYCLSIYSTRTSTTGNHRYHV